MTFLYSTQSYTLHIFYLGGSNGGCSCSIPILNGHVVTCRSEGRLFYSCDDGYEKATRYEYPTCQGLRPLVQQWKPTPSCEPKACFSPIPNGYVTGPCTFGSSCGYYCSYGYRPAQANVTCDASTHWTVNPHSLCFNKLQCPYEIWNGYLDNTCRRRYGDTCHVLCTDGDKSNKERTVYCNVSQTWEPPLFSACAEILCTTRIPNGRIQQSCPRRPESECSDFECDEGYIQNGSIRIWCSDSGHWEWLKDSGPPCIKPCPELKFKNVEYSPQCERSPGSTCSFTCNTGCYSRGNRYDIVFCRVVDSANSSSSSTWSFDSTGIQSPSTDIQSDFVSCDCTIGVIATMGGVFGWMLLASLLVCIAVCCRRKRANSEGNAPVLHHQTTSAGRSRSPSRPTISAISRWPQSGSSESAHHNSVPATECQSTSIAPPAESVVTTATQQREHSGIRIPHIEVSIITQDAEFNSEQATSAYNSLAQRPPSYSISANMPPSYSATVQVPHSNNVFADVPTCYSMNGEEPHSNNAIADSPPSYSAAMTASPPSYTPIDQEPPRYNAVPIDQEPPRYNAVPIDQEPPRYNAVTEHQDNTPV